MLVSLRWLKDFVEIEITAAELAERLTMAGLEVDAVEEKKPAFSGVVVARILSIKAHPDADKLVLCDVSTGDRVFPVVCGAKNIKEGDVVPLATVGAQIPGGYTIKLSKIRGVVSEGMLCSEAELSIGEDAAGIMILPGNLTLGVDLAEALELHDTVLDVGVTPNRPDCLSMIGIAREVAAITGKTLRYPEIRLSENDEDIQNLTFVEILDPDLCPRYTARIIKNATIKPSPLWMRLRLEAVGLRAINNIVDVTNFVMMEMGQPLHAFDFRFLEEGRIVVRRSKPGEPFISLDGKERVLRNDTLMICDGRKPVAIGGIMGGLNSEVKDDTETILIESAYFNPVSIRRSSKWLQMSTDAAFRFERGIDPQGQLMALDRAARLMADLSGGTICKNAINCCPKPIEAIRDIPLRVKKVRDTLGAPVSADDIVKTLESIEIDVRKDSHAQEETFLVTPPAFRVDLTREIDLIEEVARLYGYDRIPVTMPAVTAASITQNSRERLSERIKNILNGCGYSEVINYSFVTFRACDLLRLDADDERRNVVRIRNPLTEDQSVMRTTIVYSLLETMRKNSHAGTFDLKIFEMGRTYIQKQSGKLPEENNKLGLLLTGARYEDLWHFKDLQGDFYDLKGTLENIFDNLNIGSVKFVSGANEPFLHPGRSCSLMINDRCFGYMGEVHPDLLDGLDLRNPAQISEIDIDVLMACYTDVLMFKELSRFPSSTRDVAFLVREEMEGDAVISAAMADPEELLEKVSIFDVYDGKGISPGKKSVGLRFCYRAPDRTLTDEEVNKVHSRMVKSVIAHTGAVIRGDDR
ncbi:MAG: phenylalanine--tRNA ligase subunit beta [Deltaproteobacteria bacterium]|nr:phenylalanine--tRNA ligase subunit beta [Deltaproteobacteria bacterium]